MQKINLIAQSVLKLSHRENADNDNDDDNDDDDTHPGWIIVRVGMYSVADKKNDRSTDQKIERVIRLNFDNQSTYKQVELFNFLCGFFPLLLELLHVDFPRLFIFFI